jgi:hypothetical protein
LTRTAMRGLLGIAMTASSPRSRSIMAMLAIAVLWQIAASPWAHRPGFDNLDHVIDREIFAIVEDRLSLSEAQRSAIAGPFAAYFEAVTDLDDASQKQYDELQRRSELIGDQPAEETVGSRAAITNDAIRIRAESNRAADQLLNELYVNLEAILDAQQLEELPAVKRLVRRMNWLQDEERNRARFTRYFDLIEFHEESVAAEGVLHGIALTDASRGEIDAALRDYELAIDDRFAKVESLRRVVEHLATGEEPAAFSAKERRAWRCNVYSITNDAAARISAAIANAGFADKARQWELQYWRAWDESLFRDTPIERLESAIVEKGITLSPEQSAAVHAIIAPYSIQLHDRRREVFASSIAAMCIVDDIIGDERETMNVAQSILKLIELYDGTIQQLNGVLAPLEVAEITDDHEPDQFRSSYASFLTLHTRIELGFLDPASYRNIRFNQSTGQTEIWRPKRDPVTGEWVMAFDSIMPDR